MNFGENRIKKFLIISVVGVSFLLGGCSYQGVPSQYDLKMSTTETELVSSVGGETFQTVVKIDSRRYQALTSDENVFLSYHILKSDGTMWRFDNERTALEPIVARGVGKETLNITAPLEKGDYLIQVDLVEEGVTWFSEQGMPTVEIPMKVVKTYEIPCTEVELDTSALSITASTEDEVTVPVTVRNNSQFPIYAQGEGASRLSYHIKNNKNEMIIYDGKRTKLDNVIGPGTEANAILELDLANLQVPGDYVICVDLVVEDVMWYSDQGMRYLEIPMYLAV